MINAYILIKCKTNSIETVLKEMEIFNEIKEATAVTGEYDIIAEVEVEDVNQLTYTVAGDIHDLFGVEDTLTCVST